jgi:hypothetical protein
LQNYANHVRHDYKIYADAAAIVAAGALQIAAAYTGNTRLAIAGWIVLTLALLFFLLIMRRYALRVQNRVVRLETRLRLERVLPPDLAARVNDLTLAQLIGLRFASDAELPELVRKVFAENLATADSIKRLVKNWQPDYLRV